MPSQQRLELGQVRRHRFGWSLEAAADLHLQVFLVAYRKVKQAKVCHDPFFPVTSLLTVVPEPGSSFTL
jgi:hypothetical protein